jgi:hypothetical protein
VPLVTRMGGEITESANVPLSLAAFEIWAFIDVSGWESGNTSEALTLRFLRLSVIVN